MNRTGIRLLQVVLGLVVLLGIATGGRATILEPALRIDDPGVILFVDGPDQGGHVRTFHGDLTFPFSRLDFGFVDGSDFTAIAMKPAGEASIFGMHSFAGGTLVNFALRDTVSGQVFSMADQRNFATQYFFGEVESSYSRNPVVTGSYYNALILEWDLSALGLGLHAPVGFTMTQATSLLDGMQPAPVPLPAAALLFGSGLGGLLLSRVRKRVALMEALISCVR